MPAGRRFPGQTVRHIYRHSRQRGDGGNIEGDYRG